MILGGEEIVAFAYCAQRELKVKEALQRYHRVADAQVCEYWCEVYEVLLGEAALHEHYLPHLLHKLKFMVQRLIVGHVVHLVGHADGEGVCALFCHHLPYAVKPQFLFYIAHLVKVKVKGPALAEGGQFLFVKGDGNGLFAHAFGYRQPFVIYCRAVAAVAAAHAVHAAAIAPHGVA